jgi:tRNA/tmRNA/rRNA uracil-C5-methylase (TrmA/RlmC/RlmD family)
LPNVIAVSGKSAGFRLRARLAIRGRLGSPKLGLFELGTHHVVHIPNCVIQHPLINRVAGVVRRALVDAQVTCYSDKAHLGLARYLQIVVERSSQTAQVVIVGNSATSEPFAACFELIRQRLGEELHSLWFSPQVDRSNNILGSEFHLHCGAPSVVERFGGAEIHYPPGAFGQSNLGIAEQLIEHLRAQIPQGARVTEFYAGVGAIGLSVLPRVSDIHMNDLSPHSLQGLSLGLAGLNAVDRAKVHLVPGTAGEVRMAASEATVVIADPPRKGLDQELIRQLADNPPDRFLYVSCGLDSFLNDTQHLLAGGKMRLAALDAFNLMPFTEHVETVARFERIHRDALTPTENSLPADCR